jgi:hypothetical protein
MLFRLFVIRVLTAAPAELLKLQPIRRRFLVLARYVIAALAITALQHNVIAWHKSLSDRYARLRRASSQPQIPDLRSEI